jgi:Ras-related protein Rab-5C/Rab family protein
LFFETSAKSSLNVDTVFTAIGEKIPLENLNSTGRTSTSARYRTGLNGNGGVNLMQQPSVGSSGACAC